MKMNSIHVFTIICLLWPFLEQHIVTGAPFQNIPTPYPMPGLPNPGIIVAQTAFPSHSASIKGQVPVVCPVPFVIVNRSVPCDQSSFSRVDLTDAMLKRVLADEGGNYIPEYMASSDDEASQNFKNLISTSSQSEGPDTRDYRINKKALLSKLDAVYKQYYDSTTLPQVNPTQYRDTKQVNESGSGVGNPGTAYFVNGDSPAVIQQTHEAKSESKKQFPMGVVTQLLPAQYLYPEHRMHRRDTDGATSKLEYCLNRTTPTDDGYLRMCSTCAHTTTLASNFFPRRINEVWCNTGSNGCMYVGGVAHGGCRQSTFWMTILRKKPNSCMTVLKDGRHYITDEWERHAHEFKLGCECMLRKNSLFTKYLVP